MGPPDGHVNGSTGAHSAAAVPVLLGMSPPQFTADQIKDFVSQLETPFEPSVIEWRVANTTKDKKRSLPSTCSATRRAVWCMVYISDRRVINNSGQA
jgi:hypothetical protein